MLPRHRVVRMILLAVALLAIVLTLFGVVTKWAIPSSPVTASRPSTTPTGASEPQDWQLTVDKETIKGFADKVSAGNGESIVLFVTTPASSFDVLVYRLGWYDGGSRSADLVERVNRFPGIRQPAPQSDSKTGLVSASNWASNGALKVAGWRTGLYLLKLVASDGDQNYIPIVIRDDTGKHDILFEHSSNTDEAYNGWGGKSLYTLNSSPSLTDGGTSAAVKVSFDRPYDGHGDGISMVSWELDMVRWLEANGYDVSYVSDLDVHRDPQFAARARAVVQAGHSEYWSREMRDNLEDAARRGLGLGFFTGDTGSWAVRFEDSQTGESRVMVCYRVAALDPLAITDPTRATTHWWQPPLNRPTQQFFGVGTNGPVARSADWVVEGVESAPDLFADTGFKDGDVVPNLVGYEFDGIWTPGSGQPEPSGFQVLGSATVIAASPLPEQRNFSARFEWPETARPSIGRLTTTVQTILAGPTWTFMVDLESAQGSAYLQYETSTGQAYRYKDGKDEYAVIPLGPEYSTPGWRSLNRDLAADYEMAFGKPPVEYRIGALITRGSLALGPVVLTAPDGSVQPVPLRLDRPGESVGWVVTDGVGTIDSTTFDPAGDPAVRMTATVPTGRAPNVADTVAIHSAAGGLIVATGTIQWSWALDGFGRHVDAMGNTTSVDPRIQALTRNILNELIAKERAHQ